MTVDDGIGDLDAIDTGIMMAGCAPEWLALKMTRRLRDLTAHIAGERQRCADACAQVASDAARALEASETRIASLEADLAIDRGTEAQAVERVDHLTTTIRAYLAAWDAPSDTEWASAIDARIADLRDAVALAPAVVSWRARALAAEAALRVCASLVEQLRDEARGKVAAVARTVTP